jgi:hypothetical protein
MLTKNVWSFRKKGPSRFSLFHLRNKAVAMPLSQFHRSLTKNKKTDAFIAAAM